MVQRQASGQSLAISEAAEREAADVRRQASAQSAAIREAAEREAVELRAAVMAMSADLDLMASYITAPDARAASPAMPVTVPGRPRIRPARPGTGPVRRTEKPARSRQYRTMRFYSGTIATLVVLAVATGAYQLATRGYTFFVFRSAGTGATEGSAVFPGIIPTPKPSPAHHHPTTGAAHHGARGAHHRHHHPGGTHHVKGH